MLGFLWTSRAGGFPLPQTSASHPDDLGAGRPPTFPSPRRDAPSAFTMTLADECARPEGARNHHRSCGGMGGCFG
jgi:hypothetical protein